LADEDFAHFRLREVFVGISLMPHLVAHSLESSSDPRPGDATPTVAAEADNAELRHY
jgi:hypothetical protein